MTRLVEPTEEQNKLIRESIDAILTGTITRATLQRQVQALNPKVTVTNRVIDNRIRKLLDDNQTIIYENLMKEKITPKPKEEKLETGGKRSRPPVILTNDQMQLIRDRKEDVLNGTLKLNGLTRLVQELNLSVKIDRKIVRGRLLKMLTTDEQIRYEEQMKDNYSKPVELTKEQMQLIKDRYKDVINRELPKVDLCRLVQALNPTVELDIDVLENRMLSMMSDKEKGKYENQNNNEKVKLTKAQEKLIEERYKDVVDGKLIQTELTKLVQALTPKKTVSRSVVNNRIRKLLTSEEKVKYDDQMAKNEKGEQVVLTGEQEKLLSESIPKILTNEMTAFKLMKMLQELNPKVTLFSAVINNRILKLLTPEEKTLYEDQKEKNRIGNPVDLTEEQMKLIRERYSDVVNGNLNRNELMQLVQKVSPEVRVTESILDARIVKVIKEKGEDLQKYRDSLKKNTKPEKQDKTKQMIKKANEAEKVSKEEFKLFNREEKIEYLINARNKNRIECANSMVISEEYGVRKIEGFIEFFTKKIDEREGIAKEQKYHFTENEAFLMLYGSTTLITNSIQDQILPGVENLEANSLLCTQSIKSILKGFPNIVNDDKAKINANIQAFYNYDALFVAIEHPRELLRSAASVISRLERRKKALERKGGKDLGK